jgi:hypothetical protein
MKGKIWDTYHFALCVNDMRTTYVLNQVNCDGTILVLDAGDWPHTCFRRSDRDLLLTGTRDELERLIKDGLPPQKLLQPE